MQRRQPLTSRNERGATTAAAANHPAAVTDENAQLPQIAAKSSVSVGAEGLDRMKQKQQRAPLGVLASSKGQSNLPLKETNNKSKQSVSSSSSSSAYAHNQKSSSSFGAGASSKGHLAAASFEVYKDSVDVDKSAPVSFEHLVNQPALHTKNSETESEATESVLGLLQQVPGVQKAESNRPALATLYDDHEEENTLAAFDDVRKAHDQLFNADVSMDSATKTEATDGGSPMSIQSAADFDDVSIKRNLDLDDDFFESAVSDGLSTSEYWTARTPSEREQRMENVWAMPEYACSMYNYLRYKERLQLPSASYMRKQTELNAEMRLILIDWLIDVCVEYRMHEETLHLAVRYVDLTLSKRTVTKTNLQLVGASSCMIAAKFEEIYPPETKEFVYITDDSYTAEQVLKMERSILKDTLQFQCSVVTPVVFLTYYMKLAGTRAQTEYLAYYLCELALLDYTYIKYRPSVIACAALCLANLMTGPIPWPEHVEKRAKLCLHDFLPCMKQMMASFKQAPQADHKAVYNKYAENCRHCVSQISPAADVDLSRVHLN